MRQNKIANKLFLLISLSLVALLGLQMLFQSLYLEDFYTYSKKQRITQQLKMLSETIKDGNEQIIANELLQFSQEMGAATTIVDFYGKPLYGLDTQRAFVELRSDQGKHYRVYLDGFMSNEEVVKNLKEGLTIGVSGFTSVESGINEISPRAIWINGKEIPYDRGIAASAIHSLNKVQSAKPAESMNQTGVRAAVESIGVMEITPANTQTAVRYLEGVIQTVYIPGETTYGNGYRENKLLEEISLFLMDTLAGGKTILTYQPIVYEKVDTYVGVNNVIGMMPMVLNGRPVLLVSMISLQGVQEAVEIMNQYAAIIFAAVLVVALLGAYAYAKRLTRPLVNLRNVTTDLANLDFSTSCVVSSQDEIGELATNINKMSLKLKENLEMMQKDIALKEQLDEQRKQLIADVSHELKTPLTVMKGTCCGLMDGIYDVQDHSNFEGMLGQINQMSDMVQELLEVSRLENEVVLKEEVFVLSDVVLKVHRSLKTLGQEKSLKITLALEEYMVKGERGKIETVIRNLYNNAIFYTPEGYEIAIKIALEKECVRFEIVNTGVAIPLALQERLWEPFYRIDQSRHKSLGGSGLGLYMVKQILEKHHSDYGITSDGNEVMCYFTLEYIEEV